MPDADDIDLDDLDIDLDSPEDLFPEEAETEGIELADYSRSPEEIAELKHKAFEKTVARYAGQLNTIDLAAAVSRELEPLMAPTERGRVLDAAAVKLGLDILAGNLRPKSVREASMAIEALTKVSEMLAGGGEEIMSRDRREEVFAEIRMRVFNQKAPDKVEQSVLDAIDAKSYEDSDSL